MPIAVEAGASITTPTTLPGANQVRTYGLDGLGNWRNGNFTTVGSGDTTASTAETRTHNYVNEITGVTDTTGGTPTTTPFVYDKNGNLVNDGIRKYQYDAFNRLIQIKSVTGDQPVVAAYLYDTLNRRIQKTIFNGGLNGDLTNGKTDYLYDGQQIVEELNDSTGAWTKSYFLGQYVDELLFFALPAEEAPTVYRVLSDLLYRSVAIVTTDNVVTEAYDCDAYGNTLCYSGPGTDEEWFTDDDVTTDNPINTTIFTGRQFDPESSNAESQIYYYRARYYSPNIGRFLSRDPLGSPIDIRRNAYRLSVINKSLFRLYFGMLDPSGNVASSLDRLKREPMRSAELKQGPNLYWYVDDNPTNWNDPFGFAGKGPRNMPPAPNDATAQLVETNIALGLLSAVFISDDVIAWLAINLKYLFALTAVIAGTFEKQCSNEPSQSNGPSMAPPPPPPREPDSTTPGEGIPREQDPNEFDY
ncbi:MAG: RHS repeat-associated core domain-containing protein [Methylacidiphilales bacterium]|nr:RHS repeat-associated core domain-containing protein [Candidatus Methylacidiphilales bacterium]